MPLRCLLEDSISDVLGWSTPASRDIIRAGDGAVAFEAAGAALRDRFDLSLVDTNTQLSGVQDFVFGRPWDEAAFGRRPWVPAR